MAHFSQKLHILMSVFRLFIFNKASTSKKYKGSLKIISHFTFHGAQQALQMKNNSKTLSFSHFQQKYVHK